jgi:hypothetical protein
VYCKDGGKRDGVGVMVVVGLISRLPFEEGGGDSNN